MPTSPTTASDLIPRKISERFGEPFIAAHAGMETYTRRTVRELLPKLFGGTIPDDGFDRLSLFRTASVADQAEALVDWMVAFLAEFGDLERRDGRWYASFSEPLAERAELRAAAIAAEPSVAAAYAIVDRCAEGALDFVQGRTTGESILFTLSTVSFWFDYFDNKNYLYEINNRLAALALADELAMDSNPAGERTIVEFGGGAASAALAFLEEVESRTETSPVRGAIHYVFTELAPAFARRGERNLKGRIPDGWRLTSRPADIDRPLTEQDLAPSSCDAVWALNTFHVAKDLDLSLANTFELLRPNGVIVLGECVRPFAGQILYTEFVFDFLSNFRKIRNTPHRSTHGFLTSEEWVTHLENAGFEKIHVVPDILKVREIYPKFFTAAIVGRKPAV